MSAAPLNPPVAPEDLQEQLIEDLQADQALLDIAISYEQDLGQALLQVDSVNLERAQSQIEAIEQDWAEHNQHRDELIRQILHISDAELGSVSVEQLCALLDADKRTKATQLLNIIKKNINTWSVLRGQNSERIRGGLALIHKLSQPLATHQASTYAPPGRRR